MNTLDKLPNPNVKYVFKSVKGKNRNENQDNYLIIDDPSFKMFILFDGVGSAKNGKKATVISKDFINSNYRNYIQESDFNARRLLFDTNNYLIESGIPEVLTTVCILAILGLDQKQIIVSNVGDSRVYEFTSYSLKILSIDDKLPSNSNVITRCLGLDDLSLSEIHVSVLPHQENNFLLCTDGFYTLLEEDKIQFLDVLNSEDPRIVEKKINSLIKGRNFDDSSYIVVYN